MSGFVNRTKVNTVNPAGGISPAKSPNVGQYGWTSFDANNVNQIIEYVDLCRQYAEQAKAHADFVDGRYKEIEAFAVYIEKIYNEFKPIVDQIQPIYQDIIVRHEDIINRHLNIVDIQAQVTQDKVEIDQIKEQGIIDINKIKDESIAEYNKIKLEIIAEALVIKDQALAEADRAKAEADKSAVSASASAGFAVESEKSSVKSEESNKGAKGWYDKSYDLYLDLREGQVYRGTWNPKTGSYPDHQGTNSVWDVVLDTGTTEITYDGKTWRSGDRLVYVLAENKYDQIASGSGVLTVNGKAGNVTLTSEDVGAVSKAGDTITGNIVLEDGNNARLTLNNNFILGSNTGLIMRDHGNGNVTLSGGRSTTGSAGDLYLGYNAVQSGTGGFNTRKVRLESQMDWKNTKTIVSESGINSEFFQGPIRTEKDSNNVYHTVLGGSDSVNRGRTIIAGGESGKHMYDNTPSGFEQVHIGGDDTNGVLIHTGLQNGWEGSTHYQHWFNQGSLYSKKMDGNTTYRYYHQGFKPTASDVGAVNKSGDNNVGSLTLAAGKILDATLTHQSGYLSVYPYSSGYGLGGASGNRCRFYYKEHNNGNPADFSRGLVFNSTDSDGTSHDMNMWLNGRKVYHEGFKPTAAQIGALPLTGGTISGVLAVTGGIRLTGALTNESFTHTNKQLLSGGQDQVYLGNREGVSGIHLETNNGVAYVSQGSANHRIYHEGFKPDLGDILSGGSATKVYTFQKPTGAENGKYYPILFNGIDQYPDVLIDTASSSSASSMNNCSFRGRVRSGGWSDKSRYVSGDFTIYDVNERAIHSVVGGSEATNHCVFYVEARAFPVTVVVNSKVSVTSTGKETTYGSSVYKAGISGMTVSGDYGTKTSLLVSFDRNSGFYNSAASRLEYVEATKGVNSYSRVLVDKVGEAGSFLARRAGVATYSMMGQDSAGDTLIGTGTDSASYKSYLKVGPNKLSFSATGAGEVRVYHEGFKPTLGELGGIAASGGTMTGALYWVDTNKYLNSAGDNMYLAAKNGTAFLECKNNPVARVNGTNYNIYHQGNKPNAGDVGALATTGGTLTGKLTIRGVSTHIDLIETDSADKVWRIESQEGNFNVTEAGVAGRLRLHAGGGMTVSGNSTINGNLTISQGSILKFPSPSYSTGGQIFSRDGGQFGSQLVASAGGNLILGSGESGVALADSMVGSSTEHAYLISDGEINLITNANTFSDRKVNKIDANGRLFLESGVTCKGPIKYLDKTTNKGWSVSTNSAGYAELVFNKDGTEQWTTGLRAYGGDDWRIGSNRIFHAGYKPSAAELGALSTSGGTLTGVLSLNQDGLGVRFTGANGKGYLQAGNVGSVDDSHHMILCGINGKLLTSLDILSIGNEALTINGKKVYNEGFKPTLADIGMTGKSIGTSQALSSSADLNTYKTAGVYHQSANAGATSGSNYPEDLAGSLTVYVSAGVTQEYRVYNTSRLWRRSQYSNGAWTPWTSDYNSGNKPTATDVGALPVGGGTATGVLIAPALGVNNVSGATGHGLSFYGEYSGGKPEYGVMFAGTDAFGGHGSVTGDWATYFTMHGADNRGWIFNTGDANVGSISSSGTLTLSTKEVGTGVYIGGTRQGDSYGLIRGAVQGGGYADWMARSAGLLVDCQTSETSAHNIFKATHWGLRHLCAMDVHSPGTGNTQVAFHVGGTNTFMFYENAQFHAGDVYIRSDKRLKSNFKDINSALDKVCSLKGQTYDKKANLNDETTLTREAGLIAQDLQLVLPEAVSEKGEDKLLTISNSAVNALLVEAIKELKAEIEALKKEVGK